MKGMGDTMNFDDYMPANEEEMQQWNDRLDGLEVGNQLSSEEVEIAEPKREDYPGWKPEDGTSSYGYPLLRDVTKLTDAQVRTWGKAAIYFRTDAEAYAATGDVDLSWVNDTMWWSGSVLQCVEDRLGDADAELNAYAIAVYDQAERQIADDVVQSYEADEDDDEEVIPFIQTSRAVTEWYLYQTENRCVGLECDAPGEEVPVHIDEAENEELPVDSLNLRDRAGQVTDKVYLAEIQVPDGWRLLSVWRG